jgi:hypothetical protein
MRGVLSPTRYFQNTPSRAFLKELQNAGAVLRIEFAEFPVGSLGQLNVPGHDV